MKIFISTEVIKSLVTRLCSDSYRSTICGLWYDTDTQTATATDGKRLAQRKNSWLPESDCPDFAHIIPTPESYNTVVTLDLSGGKGVNERILGVIKKHFARIEQIKLAVSGGKFSISDPATGGTVAIKCQVEGPDATVQVKTKYLVDSLTAIKQQLRFCELRLPAEPLDPILIGIGPYVEVIMPCKPK